jgi:excisionase family DNA binding protein
MKADRNLRLLTSAEVAEHLGISERKLYDLRRAGRIPYIKLDSSVRFHPEDVCRFIDTARQESSCN